MTRRNIGVLMKYQALPPNDHVVRYVPWGKLLKDENDNVIGFLGEAFRRRSNEDALSATWAEYFKGSSQTQITSSILAIRASRSVGGKSCFAIGGVAAISDACAQRNQKVRIIHEPTTENKAHASVRRIPRDDMELLEILATEAWAELVPNSSIPKGGKPAP